MTWTLLRPLLLLAIVPLVLAGCEETVDITDATYRERLVVNGMLDDGDSIEVRFTRTLPINQPYSESQAALSDVDATIYASPPGSTSNGVVVALQHLGGGLYSGGDVRVSEGWSYRLEATWRGRTVRASTIVPAAPTVDTAMLVPVEDRGWGDEPEQMYSVGAVIDPRPGECYLLTTAFTEVYGNQPHVNTTFGADLVRERDTAADGRIMLVDRWSSRNGPDTSRLAAAVVVFDEQYYDFQRTYFGNGDDLGPFGSGTDNVHWTVEGDGIGIFIGRSMTIRPVGR